MEKSAGLKRLELRWRLFHNTDGSPVFLPVNDNPSYKEYIYSKDKYPVTFICSKNKLSFCLTEQEAMEMFESGRRFCE